MLFSFLDSRRQVNMLRKETYSDVSPVCCRPKITVDGLRMYVFGKKDKLSQWAYTKHFVVYVLCERWFEISVYFFMNVIKSLGFECSSFIISGKLFTIAKL